MLRTTKQPALPGLEPEPIVVDGHLPLRRRTLQALHQARHVLRTDDLVEPLSASRAAVATELVHMRRAGLVNSEPAGPGMMRGDLWRITQAGRRAWDAPDLSPAQAQVLVALSSGPRATSALAAELKVPRTSVARNTHRLRTDGLVKLLPEKALSPNHAAESVHALTDEGREALLIYTGQSVALPIGF